MAELQVGDLRATKGDDDVKTATDDEIKELIKQGLSLNEIKRRLHVGLERLRAIKATMPDCERMPDPRGDDIRRVIAWCESHDLSALTVPERHAAIMADLGVSVWQAKRGELSWRRAVGDTPPACKTGRAPSVGARRDDDHDDVSDDETTDDEEADNDADVDEATDVNPDEEPDTIEVGREYLAALETIHALARRLLEVQS
jgi:hypothetical protein